MTVTIPQRLPAWLRNTDFVVVRLIALICFMRLVTTGLPH